MSRTRVLSAAVLSVGLMTAAASAALSPTTVYIPKSGTTSQGLAGLANSRTFSVQVAQTTSEYFGSGDLQFTTSGTAGGTTGILNQGTSDTRTFGGATGTDFDSYVTTPGTTNAGTASRTLVLGGGTSPLQHGAQAAQLPNSGDAPHRRYLVGRSPGNQHGWLRPGRWRQRPFEIARLTLKPNTTATIAGRVVSITSAGATATTALPAVRWAPMAGTFLSAVIGDSNNDGIAGSADYFTLVGTSARQPLRVSSTATLMKTAK